MWGFKASKAKQERAHKVQKALKVTSAIKEAMVNRAKEDFRA